jgi:LacI family transcriptional regulator
MAYLKEIARAAGVSIRTVNRVLKGRGYVHADTRHKVEAAVTRLGYRPSRAARSLRTQQSSEVIVITSSVDELLMAKLMGLEQTLRPAGFLVNVVFHPTESSEDSLTELTDFIVAERPAGVAVLSGYWNLDAEIGQQLKMEGVPCIFVDSSDPAIDNVRIDRPQGVYEAVLYLAAKGRQRIAYVGALSEQTRLEGYRRALDQLQRKPLCFEVTSSWDITPVRNAVKSFMASDPQPDAFIAFSDAVALALLAGLHDQKIRVPDQVAVVGFDDRKAASLCWPRLTTVAQPTVEVGVVAAEILLRKIKGETPPPTGWSRSLPTTLIVRESA